MVAIAGTLLVGNMHSPESVPTCLPVYAASSDLFRSNEGMPEELKYKPDPKLTRLPLNDLLEIRPMIIGPPPPQEVQDAQMEFIERQNKTAAELLKAGKPEEADVEWVSVFEILDQYGTRKTLPGARALILHSRFLNAEGKIEGAKDKLKEAKEILDEQGIKGASAAMSEIAQNSSDPAAAEKTFLVGL